MSRSRSRSYSRKLSPAPGSPSARDENRSLSRRYNISRSVSREKSKTNDYHRSKGRRRSRSRSSRRSRSYSPLPPRRRSDRRRSYSRSPRRYGSSRDNPPKNRCLGVFGLNLYTTQSQIVQIFSKFGPIERVQLVVDAKSGRSRGYCFVYFERIEDAKVAKENCSGMEVDSRIIRVDYSTTLRPHTPTPGVYMGRPTHRDRDYYDRSSYRDDDEYYESRRSRRSPSPSSSYHRDRRRRYDRSRSRSYTPTRERRYR